MLGPLRKVPSMKTIVTIYHITRADLLERIRRFSFLVSVGLTMLAAYFFVPPLEDGYVTLHLEDHYRGIYNSAWVGGSVALSTTLFLSLFGFYLVRNSILRDQQTRVGQIIASTTVKKLHYLIGKAISSFVVLSIIVVVVMIVAFAMQWVRGEVTEVKLWPLVSPFLFVALPTMAIIAAMSVLFETRPILQGSLGNIIYFIIYMIYIISSNMMGFGMSAVISDMIQEFTILYPDFSGAYGIGFLSPERPIELFEWQGVEWTIALVLPQLLFYIVAFGIILVATVIFRGLQESKQGMGIKQNTRNKGKVKKGKLVWDENGTALDGSMTDLERNSHTPVSGIRANELTKPTVRQSFAPLVLAEWRLMMKKASFKWYIIAGILSILCLVMPSELSSQWLIWPVLWIWPLVLWSGMGNREARYQTEYVVVTSPRYVIRQFSAVWVSGVLLTLVMGLGMLIRLFLDGDYDHLVLTSASIMLIPSLALACGVLTGTSRTFEVLYMILWYLGPLNKMAVLDFLGGSDDGLNAWGMSTLYVSVSIGLLILAYALRSRLLQKS